MSSTILGRRVRTLVAGSLLGVALAAVAPRPANALEVAVAQLTLSSRVRSGVLTLKNPRSVAVQVEASGLSWAQAADGSSQTAPTADLVLSASTLTLRPGESRPLRVEATAEAGPLEKTYRVVLEETATRSAEGAPSRSETTIIPVFLDPIAPRAEPRFQEAKIEDLLLSFALINTGSSRFMTRRLEVVGLDSGGEELFFDALPAWYVLAGAAREYALDLPESACEAARIEVRAVTDGKVVFLPMARPACAR